MLRSSRQSSILPDHTSSYGGYSNSASMHHIYSPKKTRNPYATYSNDALSDIIDWLKQSSSWLVIGFAFFALTSGYYFTQFQWVMRELQADSIGQVVASYQQLKSEKLDVRRVEQQNKKLQKEKQQLKIYYESAARNEYRDRRSEELRMAAREEAFQSQIDLLQKATVRESKRAVIDKFGEGPHHVEFTFIIGSDANETEHHFTVETAPLDLVPHAVHLFLEQVNHELWDKAWFYLNGPHVLQAGPMMEEEEYELLESSGEEFDDRAAVLKPFTDVQLDSLAFPEYSDEFPHDKWTLGFAGRPGGPDWYINKSDNTYSHGPGGQYQHDIDEQADSCFAKVVRGFDKLNLVYKQPTIEQGDEWEFFLHDPVYIVKARIVDQPKVIKTTHSSANNTESDKRSLHKHMHKTHIDHQAVP